MPANRHAPLVSREPLGADYFVLTFRHPEIAGTTHAGQFVMIKAGISAEPPLRRPFSVLAVDPEAETFSLFIKAVGQGTRALVGLGEGEVAQCLGPLGHSFTPPPTGTLAVMVAGGYGIAPFSLFATELATAGREGRVFYGGRTRGDLRLLDRLSGSSPVVPATEDGSLGHRGRVTEAVEAFLDERPGNVMLYACGPDAMLHAVAQIAERRGLPAEASLDPWMGCGIGTCLGCVVKVQREDEARAKYHCACTDGPVFDSARVLWPGEAESLARRRAKVEA